MKMRIKKEKWKGLNEEQKEQIDKIIWANNYVEITTIVGLILLQNLHTIRIIATILLLLSIVTNMIVSKSLESKKEKE